MLLRFAELLIAHRDELALAETLDMGKPISDSLAVDMPSTRATASSGTPRPSTRSTTRWRPPGPTRWRWSRASRMGVVGAIVPWNFPMIMAAWKIGPASWRPAIRWC